MASLSSPIRERWVNVARFVADRRPDEVAAAVLGLRDDAGTAPVTTAAALAKQIAERLDRERRERLMGVLAGHRTRAPRHVRPVLVNLANPDVDLNRRLLTALIADGRARRAATASPVEAVSWKTIFISTVRTWFNTARTWLAGRARNGIIPGLLAVRERASKDGEPLPGEVARWLPGMLATRYIVTAVTIAETLADGELVPDATLDADTWTEIAVTARTRLETAMAGGEDPGSPWRCCGCSSRSTGGASCR